MIESLTPSEDATQLTVAWTEGGSSALSAETLRREAMDAWSRRERIDTGEVLVQPGLQITALQLVGAYGVNLHFSDGHEKAIYPFEYLRELSDRFDN